jgi:hypothetical protein
VVERVPVTYYPHYWSLVFPLGMYTVASTQSVRLLIPHSSLPHPTRPACRISSHWPYLSRGT